MRVVSIQNISLKLKLSLIVGILCLPIVLLTCFYISGNLTTIRTTNLESDGSSYLHALWNATGALTLADTARDAPAAHLDKAADLDGLGARYDKAFSTATLSGELAAQLKLTNYPDAAITDRAHAARTIASGRKLMGAILDASHLSLDPDLDSYYVMDAIVMKTPDLVDRLHKATALIAAHSDGANFGEDDAVELQTALNEITSAQAGVEASLKLAYAGNRDGKTNASLGAEADALDAAVDAFTAGARTDYVSLRASQTVDVASSNARGLNAMKAAMKTSDAGYDELSRLLTARNNTFWTALWITLSVVGVVTAAALILAAIIAIEFSRSFAVNISMLVQLSKGEYAVSSTGTQRGDELGIMARTAEILRDGLTEAQARREQARIEEAQAGQRLHRRLEIVDDFQAHMATLAQGMVASSGDVSEAAQSLAASAEETSRQAQVVSGAAEEAACNVQAVAAATEEVASSIQEITSQVTRAAEVALEASREATNTEGDIRMLSEAAHTIGEVVSLITDIASQTNLLALNATIEAARAGDAGKGFAVVAAEVKQLATQTASATDDITRKIAEIQNATRRTVGSIEKIVATIADIRAISTSVAMAIEQQGAATAEIAGNTNRAAGGTQQVTENIFGVGRAAEMTGAASTQLMALSGSLSGQAGTLKDEVDAFVHALEAV